MGEIGRTVLDPKKVAEEIALRTARMYFDPWIGSYILEDREGNRMLLEAENYLRIVEYLERG